MLYDTDYLLNKLKAKSDGSKTTEDLRYLLKDDKRLDGALDLFSELRLQFASYFNLDSISLVTGNGSSIYADSKATTNFDLTKYVDATEFDPIKAEVSHITNDDMETALNKLIILSEQKKIIEDETCGACYRALISKLKKDLIDNFVNSIDYNKLTVHESLFRKLRSYGCLDKVNIFTANYDLAFEYTLDKLDIEYNDGFSGFVNRKFSPRTLEKNSKRLTLDKFHGSVSWVNDNDEIKEVQPKFQEEHAKDKDRHDITKLKVQLNTNDDHVLIYPTSNKLYQTYSVPYSELMRFMLDKFESVRNLIIVIGYKYGDDHINEILTKALANPGNVFFFFEYDENHSDYIEKMTALSQSMPNVNVLTGNIMGDFTNFVKYMVPATVEKTDEEKAVELLRKVMNSSKDGELK